MFFHSILTIIFYQFFEDSILTVNSINHSCIPWNKIMPYYLFLHSF